MTFSRTGFILLTVYDKICIYNRTFVWPIEKKWYEDKDEKILAYPLDGIMST